MTLVNRISIFFLAALAIVLVAYSGLFWGIVRGHIHRQFEQEFHGALRTLVAAAEVEPGDVSWQPSDHTIRLGTDESREQVRWAVVGDRSHIVDSSRNATREFIDEALVLADEVSRQPSGMHESSRHGWLFISQHLVAPAPIHQGRESDEYDDLVIVVGRSTAELQATQVRLTALVCSLPLAGWLMAAAVVRGLCRRAVQPVTEMANAAQAVTAADFDRRLPVATTGDELSLLGSTFNDLLDRLQRSYDAQRRFTSDAAHELRTPLTVLIGQIDVALRRTRPADEYRQTLHVLRDQAAELKDVLESLLFLARSAEDATLTDLAAIDLGPWTQLYLVRWDQHARRSDLRVAIDARVVVMASPTLLTRLVDNLMTNALKYSEAGTPIVIRVARQGDEAMISVTDQGVGISAEDLETVFAPFFRSPAARSSGVYGTGLGLAIAARIASGHHGRLRCVSATGRGSTFTLHLPIAP